MGISLDMPRGTKVKDSIVLLTPLELWNQEMQSFSRMTKSVGVVNFMTP